MLQSMYAAKGIGLAAPQIGINKELLVIDVNFEDSAAEPLILINPEITDFGTTLNSYEEGCLSIPGVYLNCLLYTSPSPRDLARSRMPSSA